MIIEMRKVMHCLCLLFMIAYDLSHYQSMEAANDKVRALQGIWKYLPWKRRTEQQGLLPQDAKLTLFVHQQGDPGTEHSLDVDRGAKVKDLVQTVQKQLGLEGHNIKINYMGKDLDNGDEPLADAGLSNEVKIEARVTGSAALPIPPQQPSSNTNCKNIVNCPCFDLAMVACLFGLAVLFMYIYTKVVSPAVPTLAPSFAPASYPN